MAVDKEVQGLIETKVHQVCSNWKERMESACDECRHNMRTEMTALQLAQKTIEAERHVFITKIDQIKEVLDRVCKLLEGNGHGSMDTRITLLEQHQKDAAKIHEETKTVVAAIGARIDSGDNDRRQTVKQIWLQAVPQLVSIGSIGILFLIYLIFKHFHFGAAVVP